MEKISELSASINVVFLHVFGEAYQEADILQIREWMLTLITY